MKHEHELQNRINAYHEAFMKIANTLISHNDERLGKILEEIRYGYAYNLTNDSLDIGGVVKTVDKSLKRIEEL